YRHWRENQPEHAQQAGDGAAAGLPRLAAPASGIQAGREADDFAADDFLALPRGGVVVRVFFMCSLVRLLHGKSEPVVSW
ncbi:MAG TPA: hypothetical protein VN153_04640, partial [Tahibacter sp.]|nr:hypothetical protein [Tahibacter sp.]